MLNVILMPNVEYVEILQNMLNEKNKPIVLTVSRKQFFSAYLKIWSGGFKLTEKELKLLVDILEIRNKIVTDGVKDPYLSELVFSNKNINALKKKHELQKQGWHNHKNSLIAKKALFEHDDIIYVSPVLIPREELVINFKVHV